MNKTKDVIGTAEGGRDVVESTGLPELNPKEVKIASGSEEATKEVEFVGSESELLTFSETRERLL